MRTWSVVLNTARKGSRFRIENFLLDLTTREAIGDLCKNCFMGIMGTEGQIGVG